MFYKVGSFLLQPVLCPTDHHLAVQAGDHRKNVVGVGKCQHRFSSAGGKNDGTEIAAFVRSAMASLVAIDIALQ